MPLGGIVAKNCCCNHDVKNVEIAGENHLFIYCQLPHSFASLTDGGQQPWTVENAPIVADLGRPSRGKIRGYTVAGQITLNKTGNRNKA